MRQMSPALPLAGLLLVAPLAGSASAAADALDEGHARSRIEAAGYAEVSEVHEGNLGEWMAQASKDGHHVMVVVHPDGTVALRQQVDTPPALPVPGASPAKP